MAANAFQRIPFSGKSTSGVNTGGRTILLTEAVIQRLSGNSEVIARYPFLRAPSAGKPVSRGCKCGRSSVKKAQDSGWANNAKMALLSLTGDSLDYIKKCLGAAVIVAYVKTPKGVEKREL